jgi:hypothetical protein
MARFISSLLITTTFALTLGVATASLSAVADVAGSASARVVLADVGR